MRGLLEAITVHILLCGDARRNRDDYIDLMLSKPTARPLLTPGQPFQSEVNTGFGILVKTFFDVSDVYLGAESFTEDNMNTPEVIEAKQKSIEFIETHLTTVKLPRQEVDRGFRFWDAVSLSLGCIFGDLFDQVMTAVRTLAKEQGPNPSLATQITSPAIIDAFEKADKWLKPRRPTV